MPHWWTGPSDRWLRTTSFTSQVLILAGGILAFLTLIAFLEYRGSVATNKFTQRQAAVHSLNRRLANLGRTLLTLRSMQLRMHEDPGDDKFTQVNATLLTLDRESGALAVDLQGANLPDVARQFSTFRAIFAQYENSTAEILRTQRRIGFQGVPGLIDRIREAETTILNELSPLHRDDLIVEFSKIQFAERDYSTTLNMKLSDEILRRVAEFEVSLRRSDIPSQVHVNVAVGLTSYRNDVTEFTEQLLELELRAASATLAYSRSEEPLRAAEQSVDEQLLAMGVHLRSQTKSSAQQQMLAFVASAAFVLLLLVVLLRGTFQLTSRLKHLVRRMRTVSAENGGSFKAEEGTSSDDLAALTESFEQMSTRIARQIAAVESARNQADLANKAKSGFIATVSHEIRTPMSGLLTTLQLMEHTKLDSIQSEYLEIMRLSGDRMLDLLSDLLDFSKMEADKFELSSEPFMLHRCVGDAVALFRASAQEKGIELRLSLGENVPNAVVGDSTCLRQVLLNLVGNAIKFTDSGLIEVSVERRERTSTDRVRVRFLVRDTGAGIAAGQQASLFDPFVQVDGTATRRHAGTGLGLTICDRIITQWGGELKVKSKLGVGTAFSFEIEIECRAQNHEKETKRRKSLLPSNLADDIPLKILVVEDDPLNRRTMNRLLRGLGYTPEIVENGQQAVVVLEEQRFDLVFMDMQMPVLDGLRATQEIRTQHEEDGPTIIGLSGNASEVDQCRCLEAGMDGFLAKPFDLDEFVATIRRKGHAMAST